MPYIRSGYVARTPSGAGGNGRRGRKSHRNWWLVKSKESGTGGITYFGKVISFPKEYIGKRIRLKVEVIEDEGRPLCHNCGDPIKYPSEIPLVVHFCHNCGEAAEDYVWKSIKGVREC